jgi:hypothetical protein
LEDEEWPKIAQLHHFVEGVGGGEGVKGTGGKGGANPLLKWMV